MNSLLAVLQYEGDQRGANAPNGNQRQIPTVADLGRYIFPRVLPGVLLRYAVNVGGLNPAYGTAMLVPASLACFRAVYFGHANNLVDLTVGITLGYHLPDLLIAAFLS